MAWPPKTWTDVHTDAAEWNAEIRDNLRDCSRQLGVAMPAATATFGTSSTTFKDADNATGLLAVSFTVPRSGNLLVVMNGYCEQPQWWNVRDFTTHDIAGTERHVASSTTSPGRRQVKVLVTGMTALASKMWTWGIRGDGVNTATLYSGSIFGYAFFEVWAV